MRLIAFLLITLWTQMCIADQVVLSGATVYDGTGAPPLIDSVIVVDNGKIYCVGDDCKVSSSAKHIDVSGKYITPGLIDAHVHYAASGWYDTRQSWPKIQEYYALADAQRYLKNNTINFDRSYLCSGITAVMDVGGFEWTTELQQGSIANAHQPRYVAAGPLLTHSMSSGGEFVLAHQQYQGTHEFLPIDSDKQAKQSVEQVASTGAAALKVWYIPVPAEHQDRMDARLRDVGKWAKQAGQRFIVHAETLREAKAALRAGAEVLVHSVSDKMVDPEFIKLAQRTEVVYQTTAAIYQLGALLNADLYLDNPPQFNDPNHCIGARTKALLREGFAEFQPYFNYEGAQERLKSTLVAAAGTSMIAALNVKRLHEAGVKVATATDAGNPGAFHGPAIHSELALLEKAGIDPRDLIVMSTQNGAHAMGVASQLGSLEVGKNADLLVLNSDPGESVSAFLDLYYVMRFGTLHTPSDFAAEPRPGTQ